MKPEVREAVSKEELEGLSAIASPLMLGRYEERELGPPMEPVEGRQAADADECFVGPRLDADRIHLDGWIF